MSAEGVLEAVGGNAEARKPPGEHAAKDEGIANHQLKATGMSFGSDNAPGATEVAPASVRFSVAVTRPLARVCDQLLTRANVELLINMMEVDLECPSLTPRRAAASPGRVPATIICRTCISRSQDLGELTHASRARRAAIACPTSD